MRKERMQMYKRARSWPQKLFIGKHTRPQTRAAIYSSRLPGYSGTIHCQLSKSERYHRRNKQYQPGNTTQERRVIKKKNGDHYRPFQCPIFREYRDFSMQYAPILFERGIGKYISKGGR